MSLDGACVSSSINATVIKKHALLIHRVRQPGDRRQFIYPEMKFSCNGSVIKWIYGAVDQNRATGDLLELQIWRQTGPTSYNKQGSSLVTANISIAPNVYEYYPVTPLELQEGDIFGVHTPQDYNSQLFLYEQRESGPLNLRINSDVDSPAPSTINEALRTNGINNFPLVTLEISYDILTTDNSYKSPDMSISAKIVTTPTTSILITTTFITLDTTTTTITNVATTTVLITTGDTLIITTTGTLGMIYSLSILYYCLYSLIDTSISPSPSIPAGTPSTNKQLLLAVVLFCIIMVVIISLVIIILVCLLFTRYKKTLSLYDDVITTTDDPPTSTNPSYVPTSNNLTNNDDSSGTGLYMDINGAYESVLPPVINIEKNPAYGKCDDDYI